MAATNPAAAAAATLSFQAFEDFALSLNDLLGGNESLLTDTLALLLKSSDGQAVRGAALDWCLKKKDDGVSASAWPVSGPPAISRVLLLEAALKGGEAALGTEDREQLLERARSVLGEAPAPIALRLAKATAQELVDDSDACKWLQTLTWSRGAAADKQKTSESEEFEPAGGIDSIVVAARGYCRAASALLQSRSGSSAAKLRDEVWKVADDALKAGDSDERRVVIQLLLPSIVNKGSEGPEADAQRLSEVVRTLLERGGKAEVADALSLSVAFHEVLLDLWKMHSLEPGSQDLGVRLVRQGLLFSFKENANLRKQARFLLETATRRMLCTPKVDETLRSQFAAKGSEVEAAWKAFWEVYESLEDFASHILKSSWEGWLQRMLTFLSKLKSSGAGAGAGAGGAARTIPPTIFSPVWFEVLLVRALGHDNDSVHKFVMGQAIALDQSVVCLSEDFVLGEMLPRLSHSIDVLYPRSDVHRLFEKKIIDFFSTFVRLHPQGPAVAAKRLLLGTLGTRALHHTPLRLMLSVLVNFDGAGAVTPSECISICLQFFNHILGRMPVSSRSVISALFLKVMEHLCQSEDPTAEVDVDAATAVAAAIPDALLEDLLPLLAAWARKCMGPKASTLLVELLSGLASASGAQALEGIGKAEAVGRAASPTSAIRMTLGCVRLLLGLAQEGQEEKSGKAAVADLVFQKQLWPAVAETVGEIHRRSYLPQRSAVTALFACAYATALIPEALPLLMSEKAAVEEMLAYAEAHARKAIAGSESEVAEETSWSWLYALVFERCWSPGLPHGDAILELSSEALRGSKENSLNHALALTAATTLLAALAPKVESDSDRANLFFVLWKVELRKPSSVVDARFSVSNTESLGDWKRNRLEEYEDLHRVPREGLGRLCEWRDAIALFLLAKWRALAQLATSTPEATLAKHEAFPEFSEAILDELEAMQPPTVAYWTVVARRVAYPALFGPSSTKDEEWQKSALRRLCNGLQGSISEGTGDGSQYMCKGVMVELAAALCDPIVADAQQRLFPASQGEGPLTKSARMLLNLGEVAVAVSRAVAPPLLAALLHAPENVEGESAAFILGELLLHREATIVDGALSIGPELAAGVVDKESPGSLPALQAVCPAAPQLREKFTGTSGLPRLLALSSLADLAERGRSSTEGAQKETPRVVTATLRRLFVVMRETLGTLLNPPGSKVVANRPPTPMPMSDTHRTQLRGWQALLALGRHADRATAAELLPELFYHLNTPHVPDVRDCQELLGCALCSQYEDLAVEAFLVPALRNFDAATQVSASLLVIAIYLMKKWADNPKTCNIGRANALVNVVAPYLSHNSAYVRGTASWGFFELFEALGVEQLAIGQNAGLLKDLYDFIASSKECKKMRGRLKPVFVTFDPCGFGTLPSLVDHCTVLPKADLEASCNEEVFTDETNFVFKDGELQPVNTFMNGLKEEVAHEMETLYERSDITQYPSLSDNWKAVLAQAVEAAKKGGALAPAEASVANGAAASTTPTDAAPVTDPNSTSTSTFAYGTQRKFVPLEKPIPASEDGAASSTKRRLPLIVIASLIDKTPNLAGLCRTCEVFNCEAVCLANQKIIKDQTFQSISVTAEKWLPVKEVPKAALKSYLSELRSRGYQIVGIEQTHNSVIMDKWTYSGNTAILLGAEKEGIDADLLPWLDACVEIPQAGQIRSLNVHVSGSLAVWEYTRQFRAILDAAAAANAA